MHTVLQNDAWLLFILNYSTRQHDSQPYEQNQIKNLLNMASRRARELFKKIPKEAVVLFDCDNTTDIRPTNTIIDERDKVYTGNTVTLQYGDQQLTAKIIKLSDDRTVLTEAQRQLCAQLDAQVREPPKKRPKTTSAALLGVSEFPECESISNSVDALLDDTCVESEFPREAAELPLVSTPVNPTTRPPPVEFNTPEPSVHKACISHDKIREIMRECLLESERKNTEKWLKYEQNVIPTVFFPGSLFTLLICALFTRML